MANSISEAVLLDSYAVKKGGVPIEKSWSEIASRVATAAAKDESVGIREDFNYMLDGMYFVPGGRVIAAVGAPYDITPFNCSVLDYPEDSREGIMSKLGEWIEIQSRGGGVGINMSTLRPKGALVKGVGGASSGPIAWMSLFSVATHQVIQMGGSRRGAAMLILEDRHPDILEFIDAKREAGILVGANLSVAISNDFMQSVREDLDWDLHWGGEVFHTIPARELWGKIIQAAWASGEPGVVFLERMNEMSNSHYFEQLISTNPSMPQGTLVATREGITPIESLEGKRFTIKSSDGVWADAECRLSGESEPLIEIGFGKYKKTSSTPQHEWPVLGRMGRVHKVRADALKKGDYIPLCRNERAGINADPTLTEEDGFFLGYLFGDGWISSRKEGGYSAGIVFPTEDDPLAHRCLSYLNDRKANESSLRPQKDGTWTIQFTEKKFIQDFMERYGWEDKTHLPTKVWQSNDDFIIGFVDGLLSADGYVSMEDTVHPTCILVSSRFGVVEEFGKLLSFYGVSGQISRSHTQLNGKEFERWQFSLPKNQLSRFTNIFTISHPQKSGKLSFHASRTWRYSRDKEFARVHSVQQSERQERVWDITVYHDQHVFPADWSYTGNCSEIPLGADSVCLLGSINLTKHVSHGSIDFPQLEQTTALAVRFLDDVIDIAYYPFPKMEKQQKLIRRMGIGVMGLADAMVSCGIKYGTPESVEFTEDIFRNIKLSAYISSTNLASEKGSFPGYKREPYAQGKFISSLPPSLRRRIGDYGIRNCFLTAQAPTGTISKLAGVWTGIEPYFSRDLKMTTRLGEHSWSIPDSPFVVTADELSPSQHIDVMAAAQRHIDAAVSKTVNAPESHTPDETSKVYELAFKQGLKSVAYYRDKSRDTQVYWKQDIEDDDCTTCEENEISCEVEEGSL